MKLLSDLFCCRTREAKLFVLQVEYEVSFSEVNVLGFYVGLVLEQTAV